MGGTVVRVGVGFRVGVGLGVAVGVWVAVAVRVEAGVGVPVGAAKGKAAQPVNCAPRTAAGQEGQQTPCECLHEPLSPGECRGSGAWNRASGRAGKYSESIVIP
jgi:hypothetical protein